MNKIICPEKVFRDPIHNYIKVDQQLILDLIDSKEMQRLRRIKQLGTSNYTFHGAEHSRFTHSLGVYEITQRICDLFARKYSIDLCGESGWNDGERLVALCASLLHDIGHGAYSHTFEHIFHTDHEARTVEIITSPETEVFQILNSYDVNFPQKVAEVIKKTYPNQQVVQLISSQIDADRMDYLLRDAYYTGTEYGSFDLTRILRTIMPIKNGIAFKESGMHAVEDYVISRFQMYVQVYFHPTSRSMEVILDSLLKVASDLYQQQPRYFQETSPRLIPFLEDQVTLSDYLFLDDGVLNTYFAEWQHSSNQILADLADRFLNRHPFKSIKIDRQKDQPTVDQLRNLVQQAGLDPKYYLAVNQSKDLPYDFYRPDQKSPRTQIEILKNNGELKELSKLSPLVAALAGNSQIDCRVYFPAEITGNKNWNDFLK